MKRKAFLITLAVLGAAVVLGAGGAWYWLTGPLYSPGMVRDSTNLSAPLTAPAQAEDAVLWQIEPGIALAHFVAGEGRPVLVIHGGPGIPFSEPLAGLAPMTSSFRFHYYDQRGSGESTRPFDRFAASDTYASLTQLERTLGIGAQLADIERIRQILGEERLLLIGHSWGGLLATLYAAEFPDRVEALVLVAPADMLTMPAPQGQPDLFATVRGRLPLGRRAEYDAFIADCLDFGRLFEKSETELSAQQTQFGAYYQLATGDAPPAGGQPGGWMAMAQYLSLGQHHDYRSALNAVEAPALVIHGADDLQSVTATQRYVDALPHATLVVIEDAGHFPFEQQPDAFARPVGDFLAPYAEP